MCGQDFTRPNSIFQDRAESRQLQLLGASYLISKKDLVRSDLAFFKYTSETFDSYLGLLKHGNTYKVQSEILRMYH